MVTGMVGLASWFVKVRATELERKLGRERNNGGNGITAGTE